MSEPLRVALISASPMVLAGLRADLHEHGGIEVAAAFDGWEAGRGASFAAAQVAIVDAPGPGEPLDDGPPVLLLLPEGAPPPADWLRQGCSLLPRSAGIAQIAAAARASAAGLVAATQPLLVSSLRPAALSLPTLEELEPLTPREREVLQKMSQGLGNREIADELNISSHTAKFHVAQIIAKLDASSRAHAVAKGLRAGLVAL